MNTQTVSPTQASDEITDAQLDKVSGGAKRFDCAATATVAVRPTSVNLNTPATMQTQTMPQRADLASDTAQIRRR